MSECNLSFFFFFLSSVTNTGIGGAKRNKIKEVSVHHTSVESHFLLFTAIFLWCKAQTKGEISPGESMKYSQAEASGFNISLPLFHLI